MIMSVEPSNKNGTPKYSKMLKFARDKQYGGASLIGEGLCRDVFLSIPPRTWFFGKTVSVGDAAFRQDGYIKEVILPDGVVSIGIGAFESCGKLKEVTFPSTLRSIERRAFCDSGIESVKIDGSVDIMEGAFASCKNLRSLRINGDCKISKHAFLNCTELGSVEISGNLTVGEEAFYGCSSLEDLELGGLDEIPQGCFKGCTKLRRVNAENVTYLGSEAFKGCESLGELIVAKELSGGFCDILDGTLYEKECLEQKKESLYLNGWLLRCYGNATRFTLEADIKGIATDAFLDVAQDKYLDNPDYHPEYGDEFSWDYEHEGTPDPLWFKPKLLTNETIVLIYPGTREEWYCLTKRSGSRILRFEVIAEDGTVMCEF